MPIFGTTLQSVVNVSEDDNTNLADLAQVILQDSSMTARVLKLVNSVYYNPSSQPITTISRAIALIGFDAVRAMCLSISLVDSLVSGGNRQLLVQEMSRAIHAAIQARNIAIRVGDRSPEEIFITTLLYHLGHMAFWCFGGKETDSLLEALQVPGVDPEAAEQKILGFRLKDLTRGLAETWHLDNLLIEAVSDSKKLSTRGKAVVLSHKLASAAEKGWGAPKVSEVTREIAELINSTIEDVTPLLHEAAKDAVGIASKYGAAMAAKIIPLPEVFDNTIETEGNGNNNHSPFNPPDPILQLNILREVIEMITTTPPTLNVLLEMLLEGMHRGVGMDNAVIALCSNDRRTLLAKYAVGSHRDKLMANFAIPLDAKRPSIFVQSMEKKQAFLVTRELRNNKPELFNKSIENAIGNNPFMIAPLVINGHPAGILYGDRSASNRALDDECFNGFKLFSTSATMAIDYLALKRNAGIKH